MDRTEKIVKRKLADDVRARLVEMIETGGYAAGDTLPSERELMSRFGVGRPAIREALQYLHNIGLITISHGQRPTVQQPTALGVISQIDLSAKHLLATSPDALDDLKDARLFFEIGMVRKAADMADAKDIRQLRKTLDDQRQHLEKDKLAFVRADMAFHTAIAAITRNPIFEATSKAMLGWFENFHSGTLHWEGNEDITLDQHEQILGAIEAKKSDEAEKAMADHLNRSSSVYRIEEKAEG
jgi:DNA-binding FadR family transcriptional regulator